MKILHIITSLQRGGAEHVLADLVKKIKPLHEQRVLFFYDGPVRHAIEQCGVPCKQIFFLFFRYDPIFCLHLFYLLVCQRPCVVLSSLWSANLFSRFYCFILRIPVINVLHAQLQHEGRFRNIIDIGTFFTAQKIVAVSPSIATSCKQKFWFVKTKLITIPNGITCPQFQVPAKRNDGLTIGAVGRLVHVKNFELLISAFALLHAQWPQTSLIIVGGGPLEKKLRSFAYELGIEQKVTFYTAHDAKDFFVHFDIFVQPSWSEGLSRALLEALSYKLPVIVSGINGRHEIILHGKNGLVINPHNVHELVESLNTLIRNEELRSRYGSAGAQLIEENYSAEHMASQYIALIESVKASL